MAIAFMLCVFTSCDTMLALMQGMANGVGSAYGTGTTYNSYSSTPTTSASSSSTVYCETDNSTKTTTAKKWQNCHSCGGNGRCKYCGGTGVNTHDKGDRCGVCHGKGACVGCNGKGGFSY